MKKKKIVLWEKLPFEADSGIVNIISINLNSKSLLQKEFCRNFKKYIQLRGNTFALNAHDFSLFFISGSMHP